MKTSVVATVGVVVAAAVIATSLLQLQGDVFRFDAWPDPSRDQATRQQLADATASTPAPRTAVRKTAASVPRSAIAAPTPAPARERVVAEIDDRASGSAAGAHGAR